MLRNLRNIREILCSVTSLSTSLASLFAWPHRCSEDYSPAAVAFAMIVLFIVPDHQVLIGLGIVVVVAFKNPWLTIPLSKISMLQGDDICSIVAHGKPQWLCKR